MSVAVLWSSSDLAQTPSPRRCRRRWLIVAFAIVLVLSTVAWRLWPRVDQRFVGTWVVESNRETIHFEPGGRNRQFATDGSLSEDRRWWVKDETLFLGDNATVGLRENALACLLGFVSYVCGTSHAVPYRFEVKQCDELWFWHVRSQRGPGLPDYVLRRIAK